MRLISLHQVPRTHSLIGQSGLHCLTVAETPAVLWTEKTLTDFPQAVFSSGILKAGTVSWACNLHSLRRACVWLSADTLNNFLTRASTFLFCAEPCKLCSQSALRGTFFWETGFSYSCSCSVKVEQAKILQSERLRTLSNVSSQLMAPTPYFFVPSLNQLLTSIQSNNTY